ncbi:MAG: glycosyltransferase [Bacteroides sp.]|nr:glycosyltransferase [Bacteroides sp.]MBD5376068.1 glycosyltransferase [Bacteroides sp.]
MDIKSIKIVDPYSTGSFHEVINAALVAIGCSLSKKVTIVMGKEAYRSLQTTIQLNNIRITSTIHYKTYRTVEGDSKIAAFIRTFIGFFISLKEYLIGSKEELILFNYTNQFAFPFILIINKLLRKNVIFTLHGELELQKEHINGIKLSKFYRFIYKICLTHLIHNSNCLLLVLGKSIRNNLLAIFPSISDYIIYITHPYFIPSSISKLNDNKKMIVGTIGTLNDKKGLEDISKIIQNISDYINNNIEFHIIGRVSSTDKQNIPLATLVNNGKPIPIDIFNEEIRKLDLIIFCYPKDSYKLTASGAIMDAIVYNKPIITYHNDFFDDLMCDSPSIIYAENYEEVSATIKNILNNTIKIEPDYSKTIEKISIPANADHLKNSLREKGLSIF